MLEDYTKTLETNEKRQDTIHAKGFDVFNFNYADPEALAKLDAISEYGKIKVGVKQLEDAILELGTLRQAKLPYCNKKDIMEAIVKRDYKKLRVISDFFYAASGIYQTVCNYFAFLYRYDWMIYPENVSESAKAEKVIDEYTKILSYLDNSYIKKLCGDIALKVVKYGCYYGYLVQNSKNIEIQELPPEYCRTRFSVGGVPAVEFNMAFFDEKFLDVGYRMRVIKMFPDEFAKGYALYKQGKLGSDEITSSFDKGYYVPNYGWYLLDPACTVKFNINNSDIPIFINALPAILDLDAAQELDRKKQMQKLLKILVQKLPMDKNGDLIFDVDEARDIHNNAVAMLRRAIGVDVITTFADVQSIDISDKNTTATQDDLEKVERTVYNSLGVSRNLFNTDTNLAMSYSILDDESTMRSLILQFDIFFDKIVDKKSSNKKFNFRFMMLETTQYNYKEMSKMYKDLTANGQSKFMPVVALGHSQSSVLNLAYFENEILDLPMIMIPPLMSSTMNGQDILGNKNQTKQNNPQNNSEGKSGRPEKPDSEKSEKTIKNRESITK